MIFFQSSDEEVLITTATRSLRNTSGMVLLSLVQSRLRIPWLKQSIPEKTKIMDEMIIFMSDNHMMTQNKPVYYLICQ